ncbi:phosphotransferase family protein [Pseudofrankia inefficax]|uniref:Aminoglycoside phosphotransferase n=1 Tax=Pseudofrankia inefficax (strain DSM 45817 / CECT 9037 / DDB 130130 / EuI1c) TaxID=298654 RepID=E3J3U3_PSEI1|nr:phosphotransferase family protein [Pseudofrankia inefficax]ADP80576.1 aminoglycoside phosphotransferase [Pseudofrankia inefficax]
MRGTDDLHRLTGWLAERMPAASGLRIENADRITFGHSAEITALALAWTEGGTARRRDVVLRLCPPSPGLLEPYDMARQFTILRALEPTAVRGPAVLWLDESGDVLGRPFYVMAKVPGQVYEQHIPAELEASPTTIHRMTQGIIEQLAAIHSVDPGERGLAGEGEGRTYLADQLAHWSAELRRVRKDRLPALERLHEALVERRPVPSERITLVHGDVKPGNFAFEGGEVTGVFDWELAGIGDPLADIGYLELFWNVPVHFTSRPAALAFEDAVAYYERLTGIPVRHRDWYRSFQTFKTCVILLVGTMMFDSGASDDLRFAEMGLAIPHYTRAALRDLGVADDLDPGPVRASRERYREVRDRLAAAAS